MHVTDTYYKTCTSNKANRSPITKTKESLNNTYILVYQTFTMTPRDESPLPTPPRLMAVGIIAISARPECCTPQGRHRVRLDQVSHCFAEEGRQRPHDLPAQDLAWIISVCLASTGFNSTRIHHSKVQIIPWSLAGLIEQQHLANQF